MWLRTYQKKKEINMKTGVEGVALIKKWEGLRTKAYKDGGGVLTIGYGHTSAAGGLKVTPNLVISAQQAEDLLKEDLGKFEARVSSLVKVPLNQNQFDTLVSFDFNTGALHSSTLLKKLNAGNYSAVPSELGKWVHDNGKVVTGLVNRRSDEARLWNKATGKPAQPVSTPSAPTAPSVAKPSLWDLLLALFKGK
jgi:lysozyme